MMEAKLITWTPNPLAVIWYTYHHEKHGVPYPTACHTESWPLNRQQRLEASALLTEGWGPFLEIPVTLWSFRVPRALHAQIRVHRHISSWSQSHQLYEPANFADDGDYWLPPQITIAPEFCQAMRNSQEWYKKLRDNALPGIARMVLPQAINLGLTCGINLRALIQLVITRRCRIFQNATWDELLDLMREEIRRVDPALIHFFNRKPCDLNNKCLSYVEQMQRVRREDPHKPCDIFMQRFFEGGEI